VCKCVRESERERVGYVSVCVREKDSVCVSVSVCVCERAREKRLKPDKITKNLSKGTSAFVNLV